MKPGDRVTLIVPENARLHGTSAVVLDCYSWGALVESHAAATGRFRAGWDEMTTNATTNGKASRPRSAAVAVREPGGAWTGDACPKCQGPRMLRTGPCVTCQDCGENSGCG